MTANAFDGLCNEVGNRDNLYFGRALGVRDRVCKNHFGEPGVIYPLGSRVAHYGVACHSAHALGSVLEHQVRTLGNGAGCIYNIVYE